MAFLLDFSSIMAFEFELLLRRLWAASPHPSKGRLEWNEIAWISLGVGCLADFENFESRRAYATDFWRTLLFFFFSPK